MGLDARLVSFGFPCLPILCLLHFVFYYRKKSQMMIFFFAS